MDYVLFGLRLALAYVLLCLGVEVYTTIFQFEPAHRIANQAITDHNYKLADHCLAAMDDILVPNPFNLPAAIKAARTDFLKKEGCK